MHYVHKIFTWHNYVAQEFQVITIKFNELVKNCFDKVYFLLHNSHVNPIMASKEVNNNYYKKNIFHVSEFKIISFHKINVKFRFTKSYVVIGPLLDVS
jgi:hypothetical protein